MVARSRDVFIPASKKTYMKLTFHGAAKQVTGSNYLLEVNGAKYLIDCGLHQGGNFCERHNWNPFPYPPNEISAVFVTHSHVDHIGRLPKLAREGFRGPVYSTFPTKDAAELLLLDSDHILAQDAEKFKQPLLFTKDDVLKVMEQWHGVEYHTPIIVGSGKSQITATFGNAGNILGSSFLIIEAAGKKIIFSGDLGNSPSPIIGAREVAPVDADYAVMECTYGDRVHESMEERKGLLEDRIEETAKRNGVLVIPAFAMERTQELLFELHDLVREGRVPPIPVFVDSPLAIKLTEIYKKYARYFDAATQKLIREKGSIFDFPGLKFTLSTEESKHINDVPPPKIIIAGSGMSHGGRIMHHERRYLPGLENTLLIVGYQAVGSLGRQILDGVKTVRMFGEQIPVRCHIEVMRGYSAHADQPQLLEWLHPMRTHLKTVFLTHGEEEGAKVLAAKISDELAIHAHIPSPDESFEL